MMLSEPVKSYEEADLNRLSIFQEDWWLKIAKGSARLDEVQVLGPNGVVIGRLPYIVHRNALGIPSGRSPILSRVGGPIVSNSLSDERKRFVLKRLIEKLPKFSFTFSIAEHMPNARLINHTFNCAGFECFEQTNFSLPPHDVASNLGKKLREHIRQAQNKLELITIEPDIFAAFYQRNLDDNSKKSFFSLDIASKLIATCMTRDPPQARIIAACKKRAVRQPEIDAAICVVWDKERCYYWLSTRCNDSHPDAIKLLIKEAMMHSARLGLIFDADGVNTQGADRLFRLIFGMPNEEKRYIFMRTSRLTKICETSRSHIDRLKKFAVTVGLK